jgi:hypothetical protein
VSALTAFLLLTVVLQLPLLIAATSLRTVSAELAVNIVLLIFAAGWPWL